jgi:hypothetical protein
MSKDTSAESLALELRKRGPSIRTLESLRSHLQTAIELEHSTIPAYLSALYSIKEDTNREASTLIRSVVMEEMLHMALAANVLTAVGGYPSINHAKFVPSYPTPLPHSNASFEVSLERFSKQAIRTFLRIERPEKPDTPPKADGYSTIGQFYAALEEGLKWLCAELGEHRVFTGAPALQVTPEYYYGGGGEIVVVKDLESALKALHVIVAQGEGIDHTLFDGDHHFFHERKELAHYFRFNELHEERHYQSSDKAGSPPTGKPLPVDWEAVYPMRKNPKAADYPVGSEIRRKLDAFNEAYMGLLNHLHRAFNGEPKLLFEVVPRMYALKELAVSLMKIPSGDGKTTVGPSFEFVGPIRPEARSS